MCEDLGLFTSTAVRDHGGLGDENGLWLFIPVFNCLVWNRPSRSWAWGTVLQESGVATWTLTRPLLLSVATVPWVAFKISASWPNLWAGASSGSWSDAWSQTQALHGFPSLISGLSATMLKILITQSVQCWIWLAFLMNHHAYVVNVS